MSTTAQQEAAKRYRRAYYQAHKEEYKKRAIDWARKHPEASRASSLRRYYRFKDQVFAHYGLRCALCGETDRACLCIDYIEGGGKKHQRECSVTVYEWLVRHNFPPGFRTLCANCNERTYREQLIRQRTTTKAATRSIQVRERRRMRILSHYSGNPPRCVACGCQDPIVLCIDHIKGDGAAHRQQFKGSLYLWLQKHRCPDGFQVLCRNCNMRKEKPGWLQLPLFAEADVVSSG